MSAVSIKYKNVEKATMDESDSKTLKTGGKYCDADIVIDYINYSPRSVSALVSVTSDIDTSEWSNLISLNSSITSLISQHRSDTSLFFTFSVASEITYNKAGLWYVSVRSQKVGNQAYQGTLLRTNATGVGAQINMNNVDLLNGTSSVSANMGCPRINSNGSVDIYVYSAYPICAADYNVTIGW